VPALAVAQPSSPASVPPTPPPSAAAAATEPSAAPVLAPGAGDAAQQDLDRRYQELLARQNATEQRLHELELQRATQPAVPAAVPNAPEAPLAGYSDKNFFLRDANDDFVLIPKGRLNVDTYTFLNRGDKPAGVVANSSADPRPKNTIFLRRARFGVAGTIAKVIDFRFEAEFASLPTAGQYATMTDASIIYNSNPYLKFELGQTYAPFSLENQTSENYTDFMERSASVRFAVPLTRDTGAMIFGEAPHNIVRYHVGVFNGDGQNFKNLDNHPAYIGRVTVSPLGALPGHPAWLDEVWIGGSFWRQTATNIGGAAAPSTSAATQGDLSSVTTQSGLSIFSSNYSNGVDASANAIRSHLAPDGTTSKYALELNVPLFERYGVRGEYLHQSIELREYQDTSNMGAVGRARGARGRFVGSGGYAEMYAWLGGDVHADHPGLYASPHWKGYKAPPPVAWSVLLAAKYEHIGFDVEDLPTAASATGKATTDAGVGHYGLDIFELGASLWYTRHSRLAANYVLNYLGAGHDRAASSETKNLFYKKSENELLFRWAVNY
jgi:hypothetical protein